MKNIFLKKLIAISMTLALIGCSSSQSSGEQQSRVTTKFLNYDETVLYVNTIPYGSNAVYEGEKPKRESDNYNNYTFSGWDKSLENITEDTNFYAQYSSETRKYKITFLNYNDEVLDTQNLEYDTLPVYAGDTPTKPSNEQYSYLFTNWSPQITKVTGDTTYKAQFSTSINTYTVNWVVDDTITSETYEYGETPVFKGSIEKPKTAERTYEFNGWVPSITEVTKDITYTAQYLSAVNKYNIMWFDYNDTLIKQGEYEYGTVLQIQNPTRQNTAQYSYEFVGWEPEMVPVVANASYKAKYKETLNSYTITWNVDGTKTQEIYQYGDTPSFKGSTDKNATAEYTYTFSGWTPTIKTVTQNTTYTAQYNSTKNKYSVTWKNWDGTILKTDSVEYGVTPSYGGSTPTKEQEELYYYEFAGWSPARGPITENIEYTALFNKKDIYEYDFTSDNSECYITKYKANLESVTIPEKINNIPVTTLKESSFASNNYLKSIVISKNITSIERIAFAYCSSLEEVILSNGLKTIGEGAFYGCGSIKSITIPDNVKTIGRGTFQECVKLDTITLPFIGKSRNEENYLSYIFGGVHYENNTYVVSSLKKVILSSACDVIHSYAFYKCENIKTIYINANDLMCWENPFSGCSSLTEIRFTESVNSIKAGAFKQAALSGQFNADIHIPNTITYIGDSAFPYQKNVETKYQIYYYGTLESWLNIEGKGGMPPKIHLCIGDNYQEENEITIAEGTTTIKQNAFAGTQITSIIIPEGVTEIEQSAFENCSELKSVVLPTSLITIGDNAFKGCSSLSEIELGNNIETLGENCFEGCAFVELTIPNNIKSIGSGLLKLCTKLETLTIPFIGNTLNDESPYFGTIFGGGAQIPETLKDLYVTGGKFTNFTFDSNTKYRLINLHLIEEFSEITQGAFQWCEIIKSVQIDCKLTEITKEAFYMCNGLETVSLSNNIQTIGNGAFRSCNNLQTVYLESSITLISRFAFGYCESLETINYNGTIDQWNSIEKEEGWNIETKNVCVHCLDGDINL